MRSLLVVSLTVLVGACASEADPAAVRERIDRTLPPLVDESTGAADGADATFGAMSRGFDTLDLLAPGLLPGLGSDAGVRLPAMPAFGEDGQTGADVARELNETLFTDASYEGGGVFVVPTTLLCPADDLGVVDADCVAHATQAALRIRAELVGGDGLDLALVVGANRDEPITIALRPRSITATVDLGELADAARALAPAFGEPDLRFELAGVISARLEVLGTAHVAVAITIDQPVHVAFGDGALTGDDAFRLDTAQAHPLVRIELDGVARQGSAQVGLGATEVHVPDDTGPATDVDLPGLAATATLIAGEPVRITGISLGDRTTTVSVGGEQAIGVDLNRDAGRRLDLTIAGDELDATFTVSPAFDLRVAVDHAILGDTPPRYDVTRVALDGAPAPALRASTQLAVVAGQLTIETDPVGYGATIAAGACVGEEWRADASGDYSVLVSAPCD